MAKEPLLEVDLGRHNNGVKKFYKVEELRAFYDEQFENWRWLSAPPVAPELNQPWNFVTNNFTPIQNELHNVEGGQDGRMASLQQNIASAFDTNRIPLSVSPIGQFIAQLREENALAAAAAMATWFGTTGLNLTRFEHVKGMVLMAAFDTGMTAKVAPAFKATLSALGKSFQEARDKTEAETIEQRQVFEREKALHRKYVGRAMRHSYRSSREARKLNEEKVSNALIDMEATKTLYTEHMKLKSSVEYWTKKARNHKDNERTNRFNLILFAVCGGLSVLIALLILADHAIELSQTPRPLPVYFILASIGIVLVTLAFWPARILTRLFLSEHHLAIDAEERATMAMTYLALTAEERATPEERQLVLGSLFRPTSDGVVKDDAAPEMSPAAIVSRIGAKP